MKVKVIVEIEVPDGATHYGGGLLDDPVWWKSKLIANFPQWLYYDRKRKEWMIHGDNKPHFLHELKKENKAVFDQERQSEE